MCTEFRVSDPLENAASSALWKPKNVWDLTSNEDFPLCVNSAVCPMMLQTQTLWTTPAGIIMP